MEIKRLQTLATETFEINKQYQPFMYEEYFHPKTNVKIRPHDMIVRYQNTATYDDKSLTALVP